MTSAYRRPHGRRKPGRRARARSDRQRTSPRSSRSSKIFLVTPIQIPRETLYMCRSILEQTPNTRSEPAHLFHAQLESEALPNPRTTMIKRKTKAAMIKESANCAPKTPAARAAGKNLV